MPSSVHPKVLFIGTSDAIGGLGRVMLTLAREFTCRNWRVRTVFPETPESEKALAWCHNLGVAAERSASVRDIVAPHTLHDLRALRRFVKASGAEIVNIHYGGSHASLKDIVAVRLAGARRCVVTVHHPTPWSDVGEQKRRMTRWAASLSDAVVAVSSATHQVLSDAGIASSKLHVIYNGLQSPNSSPTQSASRERLGLPHDGFVVSCLARLVPEKGLADLINAAARIPDPDRRLRLVIGGEGPERGQLERLAASRLQERAIFLGYVPDTADLYASADVFALPSYLEGFGLVYVEAAFHGVPSVGTAVGGVPEAISDGNTGLIVPLGDRAALTEALIRLRDDPQLRRRMGDAARARAYAEFTEKAMVDHYERVFRR